MELKIYAGIDMKGHYAPLQHTHDYTTTINNRGGILNVLNMEERSLELLVKCPHGTVNLIGEVE